MDNIFNESGEIDFDKLNPLEREQYLKLLQDVSNAELTIQDWKNYVSRLREAVETSLADEPLFIHSLPFPFLKRENPKIIEYRARLKNLLIFERFLLRPDMAKKALEEANKRIGKEAI